MFGTWSAAGLPMTAIGCYIFRATGITDYLTKGGRIEVAQRMAATPTPKPPMFATGATMTSVAASGKDWNLRILS